MVCEVDLLLYLSRMREAGLRDRPSQISPFMRDSQFSIAGIRPDGTTTITTTIRKITLEYLLVMTIPQRSASSLRLKLRSSLLRLGLLYIETDAMVDCRADLCRYRYLDLRSSPLRSEDVRSVRHVFKQRVGLL
jgi:hypothetical protein